MRKGQVDAAAVNVQRVAQIFERHGRALDVPAGTSRPDRRLPEMLAGFGSFPQGEVARVVLVVAVHIHARAGLHPRHVNFGKFAVGWKFRDLVIRRAFARVGQPLFGESLDQLHHVVDMLGGAGNMFGRLQIQGAAIVQIRLNVFVRVFANADARRRRFLNDAIVHVGEVHHLNDAKSLRLQVPPQDILKHKCAEIPNVSEIVDRRPASVRAHFAGHQRNKRLRLAGHGVVKADLRLRGPVPAAQCGLCAHRKRAILTDARGCSKRSVGGEAGVSWKHKNQYVASALMCPANALIKEIC